MLPSSTAVTRFHHTIALLFLLSSLSKAFSFNFNNQTAGKGLFASTLNLQTKIEDPAFNQ